MSASPVLRIGVAGLGRAFSLMLPTFLADPRVRLVAAADPRAEARARFASDFGAPAFDDVVALCARPEVDVVYVASPHQLHAEHVALAAAAGRHVLVEKPMAITLADCDRMLAATRAAGVHLIVGHSHSFDTPYLATRALIESGRFGRLRMVNALNFTDFLYRPRRPEELDTAQGGGIVFSQGAHQVDIVRLLAGGHATSVRAHAGAWDPRRPTEGAYAALLGFADGAFASLTYSGYGHFDSDELVGWVGELGAPKDAARHGASRRALAAATSAAEEAALKAARTYGGPTWVPPDPAQPPPFHQHFGFVVASCDGADLRPLPQGIAIAADDRAWVEPLPRPAIPRHEVIDELVAAVTGAAPPVHDGAWALATLEACLAILDSARLGREVPLARQIGPRDPRPGTAATKGRR